MIYDQMGNDLFGITAEEVHELKLNGKEDEVIKRMNKNINKEYYFRIFSKKEKFHD